MERISNISDRMSNDRTTGNLIADATTGISKCLCCTEIDQIATWNVKGNETG